jgi:uridine kinase
VKRDRTKQWIELGQAAVEHVIGLPGDSTEDSWSLVRACCVAPVVELIRVSNPRVFAISGSVGAGKSTVAQAVASSLANMGKRAVALSLDDFYLSRIERERRGIAWRAAPGSHDIDLAVETLAAIQNGSQPLLLPRFDPSRDDRGADGCLEAAPDVVIFDGWIIGYDGQGYERLLPYLDWHLHLDVPKAVARERRFAREAKLRLETGRAFSPEKMQRFWDDVLGPGFDTWVQASAAHADILVRFTDAGPLCLVERRLDEYLPPGLAGVTGEQPTEE